jgi:hypothetical protein
MTGFLSRLVFHTTELSIRMLVTERGRWQRGFPHYSCA